MAMRDAVYRAMLAAVDVNMGFLYYGRDQRYETGVPIPAAGKRTLLMLDRRGWGRLVWAHGLNGRGQRQRYVAGVWLTPRGRLALRDEIEQRGEPMPERLRRRPRARAAATTAPAAAVDGAGSMTAAVQAAGGAARGRADGAAAAATAEPAPLFEAPPPGGRRRRSITRSITEEVDPFLLATSGRRTVDPLLIF